MSVFVLVVVIALMTMMTHTVQVVQALSSPLPPPNKHPKNHIMQSARDARILAPASAILSTLLLPNNHQPAHAAASTNKGSELFDAARSQYFDGSLTSSVIALRISGTLRKRGYLPYNTLLASSLSGDEVNVGANGLVPLLQSKLISSDVGVLNLAAAGDDCGVPLPDSIATALSHAPVDGKVVLVYAPNVGIDQAGTVGTVERVGQDVASDCASVSNILSGTASSSGLTKLVTGKMKPITTNGNNNNDKVAAATMALYEVMNETVHSQVQSALATATSSSSNNLISEVTLIGGIIVNRGHGSGIPKGEDYFQPLTMKAFSSKGGASTTTQLYNDVFGDLRTPRQYL